jgi:ribose/xylose/arabinose/galactoside ABC-type transport system permease subunit
MVSITENVVNRFGDNNTEVLVTLLENVVWPILVLTFLGFGLFIPMDLFYSFDNIQFIIYSSAGLGILVLAESICLLSGNFDLSIGAVAGFTAVFSALLIQQWVPGLPGVVGVLVALALGAFVGFLNGVGVGVIGVNPFLMTLTFFIIFGEGTVILTQLSMSNLPESFLYLGGGDLLGFKTGVWLLLALFAIAGFVLKYTRIGLAVYAVGGDEQSAKEAGYNTTRIVILVYVVSGFLSALAGLVYAGYIGTVTPTLANRQLFPAFAAAVVGGISLFGGRGKILGALAGVLLLSTIQSGLVLIDVPSSWVATINGVILLAAVLLYTAEARLRQRILSA